MKENTVRMTTLIMETNMMMIDKLVLKNCQSQKQWSIIFSYCSTGISSPQPAKRNLLFAKFLPSF